MCEVLLMFEFLQRNVLLANSILCPNFYFGFSLVLVILGSSHSDYKIDAYYLVVCQYDIEQWGPIVVEENFLFSSLKLFIFKFHCHCWPNTVGIAFCIPVYFAEFVYFDVI